MTTTRRLLVALLLLASSAARSAPAAPTATLAEASAKSKETYDAARKDLLERGKKAKAAAAAGDYAVWKPANEAYMQQIAAMTAICEVNVAAVTSASDLAHQPTKAVVGAFIPYVDVASSMLKARLQLLSYENLADHLAAADRTTILKALAPQYLATE